MSNCFSCFTLYERRKVHNKKGESEFGGSPDDEEAPSALPRLEKPLRVPIEADFNREGANNNIQAQTFNFRELATATKNFRQETLLGEGGFGRVYKGQLHKIGQTVAVKQLDRNGMQGNKEFLVEVLMLSNLHHQNLVNLIGYCADGDQRLLVYEFMSLGSLEDHLLDLQPKDTPLNWCTRLKIALGAAKGLEYLHDIANPPVIYRDLKSSNILLDEEYNAKLSDFGLAKLGPLGEKTHVSSRVMGTYGYCAPEYQRTGHLTLKSDIYSYGVVLLEIITGRRAIDPTRPINEQNLVSWAEPYFRDPSKFPLLGDPLLQGNYPIKSLNQVVAIAAMCLQDEASVRPLISDVVTALSFLGMAPDQSPSPPHPTPLPESALTPAPPEPTPTPAAPAPALAPTLTPHLTTALDPPQLAPILIPPLPAPAPSYDVVPQPAQPQPPSLPLAHVPDLPQPTSPALAPVLAPASSVAQVPTSPVASAPKLAPILATVLSPTSPLAQIQDSPQAPSPALVLVPVLASASASPPVEVVAAAQASSPYLASELAPVMASITSSASPVALAPAQASPSAQVPSSPQSPSPFKAPDSPLAQVPASPSFLARAPYLDPAPMHDDDKGENSTESDSSNDDTDESESASENEDCEEEVENAIEWGSTSRNAHQRFLVATDA